MLNLEHLDIFLKKEVFLGKRKFIMSICLSYKDINGGLGFKEEVMDIYVNNGFFEIKTYTEKIIRLESGENIVNESNIVKKVFNSSEFLNYISENLEQSTIDVLESRFNTF